MTKMDDIIHQVQEFLHIPDNIKPLMDTLKALTTSAAKFAKGEGNSEELHKITDMLGELSHMMEKVPEGPVKNMIMGLKGTALKQLEGVKGADKVIDMLKKLGTHTEACSPASAAAVPPPTLSTDTSTAGAIANAEAAGVPPTEVVVPPAAAVPAEPAVAPIAQISA